MNVNEPFVHLWRVKHIWTPGSWVLILILLNSKHFIMSTGNTAEWVYFLRVKGKLDLCLEIITTTENGHKHTHGYVWAGCSL